MRIFLFEGHKNPGVVNALARNFMAYGHGVYGDPLTDYMRRIGCKEMSSRPFDKERDLIVYVHLDNALENKIDELRRAGYRVIGASKFFADAEKSKDMGQRLLKMTGYRVPASFGFSQVREAIYFVERIQRPFVVKIDDSSDPMGVIIPKHWRDTVWILENEKTIQNKRIVLQELLEGVEIGFGGFFNGYEVDLMSITFEHKRVFDGNQGPNCAEMGTSFLALDIVNREKLADQVFRPLYPKLRESGYRGFIDLNGIITDDLEWRVLEFTCRFGSPQTEIMIWYISDDLGFYLWRIANGEKVKLNVLENVYSVGVTLACAGYPFPNACRIGSFIYGDIEQKFVIPMSVKFDDRAGLYRTNGGRIVTVTGLGNDMESATEEAYQRASGIDFLDSYKRLDIGMYGWNKTWYDLLSWLQRHQLMRRG